MLEMEITAIIRRQAARLALVNALRAFFMTHMKLMLVKTP
jgi:hypothetical protein